MQRNKVQNERRSHNARRHMDEHNEQCAECRDAGGADKAEMRKWSISSLFEHNSLRNFHGMTPYILVHAGND